MAAGMSVGTCFWLILEYIIGARLKTNPKPLRNKLSKVNMMMGQYVLFIKKKTKGFWCIIRQKEQGRIYIVNATQITVRKARKHSKAPPDLFSKDVKEKDFHQLLFEF